MYPRNAYALLKVPYESLLISYSLFINQPSMNHIKGNSAHNTPILISMYINWKNSGLNNFNLPFPIFENKT